jgi:hypothetical protein
MSKDGHPYRVSSFRCFRRSLVQVLGRRHPGRTPRAWGGRYRWLSAAEHDQIRLLTAQGRSGRAIARVMRRDRRTIDRWRKRLQPPAA